MEAPFQISREAFNVALPRVALESSRAAQSSYRLDCAPFGDRHVAPAPHPQRTIQCLDRRKGNRLDDEKNLMQHSTSAQELIAALHVSART
ncbi:hypothetical protein AAC387_Pa04g0958 [Persea americana]